MLDGRVDAFRELHIEGAAAAGQTTESSLGGVTLSLDLQISIC
jgi:hypothetical protein